MIDVVLIRVPYSRARMLVHGKLHCVPFTKSLPIRVRQALGLVYRATTHRWRDAHSAFTQCNTKTTPYGPLRILGQLDDNGTLRSAESS